MSSDGPEHFVNMSYYRKRYTRVDLGDNTALFIDCCHNKVAVAQCRTCMHNIVRTILTPDCQLHAVHFALQSSGANCALQRLPSRFEIIRITVGRVGDNMLYLIKRSHNVIVFHILAVFKKLYDWL